MREGDELFSTKRHLLREINQYNEDMGRPRISPEELEEQYTDDTAKAFMSSKVFEDLYEHNVKKPSKIGSVGSMRMGRDIGRKKKSSKAKSKRKVTKKSKKGCGCK